ncbi:LemA family protein [Aerococcus urinae]
MIFTVIFVVILIVLVLIVVWGIGAYNRMIQSKEMIDNSMGQIAAQVESRWDALTNLIQATKNYQSHEADTLINVVKNRQKINPDATVEEVEHDQDLFQKAMRSIDVVVEQYPELKAASVYQTTMDSVNNYENNVRQARMIFNDTVTKYNRTIKTFPNSLIAGMTGFYPEEYFRGSEEKQEMPQW